jgi:uncharacterized membrane protein YfcA
VPPGLADALALPGLWVCAAAILGAGVVYGFAGFGAALIALPILTRYLEPEAAVAAFALAGLGSALTLLPRVVPQADLPATGWMLLAAALTAPPGLWVLTHAEPTPLRWAICGLVALTLVAVMSGWRLRLGSGARVRMSLGAAAGLVGGMTGLVGPIVILTNLASGDGAARMRANLATFLTSTNFVFLPILGLLGALTPPVLWLGALFLPLYVLGTELGHRLFRPGRERLYRGLAYAAVALAVLLGLPLGGG